MIFEDLLEPSHDLVVAAAYSVVSRIKLAFLLAAVRFDSGCHFAQPEELVSGDAVRKFMRFEFERVPDTTVHDVPMDEEKRSKCPVALAQVGALAVARSVPNEGGIGEVSLTGHKVPWPDNQ